jgi:adenylate kinase family enzyme
MRIDIVGIAGSGKSTLAEKLSKKLAVPHIQIDEFWFEAGGRQGGHDTPNIEEVRAHIRSRVEEAIRTDAWVSDGIYLRVQDLIASRADVIIFLDISLWTRLRNHTRRAFFEPKRHAHLTWRDEITFYKEIVRRTFTGRPKLIKFIEEHKDKVVTLRSYRQIDEYVDSLVP